MDSKISYRQKGAVLAGSLIFLVVATMLVITTMSVNTMEEKMAGNSRDHNLSFQAAEAALDDARRDIDFGSRVGVEFVESDFTAPLCGIGNLAGLCRSRQTGSPIWVVLNSVDGGWNTGLDVGNTVKYGTFSGSTALLGVAKQPRYIIEFQTAKTAEGNSMRAGQGASSNALLRISARGYGMRVDSAGIPTAQTTLQAIIQPLKR